jgi:hypothetical protein
MDGNMYYVVMEVECICCAEPHSAKHSVVGIFSNESEAINAKKMVDEYRKKQGLIFPHSETQIDTITFSETLNTQYQVMTAKKRRGSRGL